MVMLSLAALKKKGGRLFPPSGSSRCRAQHNQKFFGSFFQKRTFFPFACLPLRASPLRPPYAPPGEPISRAYAAAPYQAAYKFRSKAVTDFIVLVLGTGAILGMAGYAALCARI
jgi:hypothetical protein